MEIILLGMLVVGSKVILDIPFIYIGCRWLNPAQFGVGLTFLYSIGLGLATAVIEPILVTWVLFTGDKLERSFLPSFNAMGLGNYINLNYVALAAIGLALWLYWSLLGVVITHPQNKWAGFFIGANYKDLVWRLLGVAISAGFMAFLYITSFHIGGMY